MKSFFRRFLPILLALILVTALASPALAAGPVTVTCPRTSAGTVGNTLSTVKLKGGSATDADGNPVPGTFTWLYPNTVMESYGYHKDYPCLFVPDDASLGSQICYPAVSVYRLNLQIAVVPEAGELEVGHPISEAELIGGVASNYFEPGRPPIAGSFHWVDEEETFDAPGEYTRAVIFMPENDVLYNPATVTYERLPDKNFADAFVTVTVVAPEEPPEPEPTETPEPEPTEAPQETPAPTAAPAPTEAPKPEAPQETPAVQAEPKLNWFQRLWARLFG